jgi:hypothetical protein
MVVVPENAYVLTDDAGEIYLCKVPLSLVFDPGDEARTCGGAKDSEFEAEHTQP